MADVTFASTNSNYNVQPSFEELEMSHRSREAGDEENFRKKKLPEVAFMRAMHVYQRSDFPAAKRCVTSPSGGSRLHFEARTGVCGQRTAATITQGG